MEDRAGRIETVQRALAHGAAGAAANMTSFVRLRWVMPPPQPSVRPESLEKTFYTLQASPVIPFIRYFAAGGKVAPLLKLGLQSDGRPIVNDPRVFAAYMKTPVPNVKGAVIAASIPLAAEGLPADTAFVLYIHEDGTTDITLEVPQRGMTFLASVAAVATAQLEVVMSALGFGGGANVRDLHATYSWTHPAPQRATPLTAAKLRTRVEALTPFLELAPALPEETPGRGRDEVEDDRGLLLPRVQELLYAAGPGACSSADIRA
jgi:hypothetical protein